MQAARVFELPLRQLQAIKIVHNGPNFAISVPISCSYWPPPSVLQGASAAGGKAEWGQIEPWLKTLAGSVLLSIENAEEALRASVAQARMRNSPCAQRPITVMLALMLLLDASLDKIQITLCAVCGARARMTTAVRLQSCFAWVLSANKHVRMEDSKWSRQLD